MDPIRIELPTEFRAGNVNSYLFVEPEPILVDTGLKSPDSWQALVDGMTAQGVTVADLKRIVITHPHTDHIGQAPQLLAQSEADLWIADIGAGWAIDFQREWQDRILYYENHFLHQVGLPEAMQRTVKQYFEAIALSAEPIPADRVKTFPLDATLMMGGLAWQVIYTPGHASTQTCFYQPETRQFLSADMLLHKTPTPVVERPASAEGPRIPGLPQHLTSLDIVEALEIDKVYPGHGDIITNHRQLIQRQRARIHQRKAEALHLIEAQPRTVVEIVDILYSSVPPQFRFTGLWMTVGYLDLLKQEGVIEEREVDGVWIYHKI